MRGGGSRIAGMGAYLPERVVTNSELAQLFNTTEQWIVERSGILERRWAAQGEGSAALGAHAATRAIQDAGWSISDVEFVIFATLSPEHLFPGSGCYMQAMLGIENIGVLDIRNQCSGFPYGLTVAHALIASGQYSRILFVGSEAQAHCFHGPAAPANMAILFGDGAGAIALEASTEEGFIASVLHADGRCANSLKMEVFDYRRSPIITKQDLDEGRQYPTMEGARVFLRAVEGMLGASQETLEKAGKTIEQVDLVIPHQANLRICETVRKRLGIAPEKVFVNIQTRGNTTAASIPLAMVEAREAGRLKRGDLVLTLAFGSGFTWGATLLRY
jgi:3-oxoacyl-[acyl-carrier-protein] synthase-3